jgi:hypothetical protein
MFGMAWRHAVFILQIALLSGISAAAPGEEMQHDHAQTDHSAIDHSLTDHSKMDHAMPGQPGSMSMPAAKGTKPRKKNSTGHVARTPAPSHAGHDMATHDMAMKGFFGPYALTREGSGTSWVPEATPASRAGIVNKVSVGGIYDLLRTERAKFGIGGLASRYLLPGDLKTEYGRDLTGFMVFGRLKLL